MSSATATGNTSSVRGAAAAHQATEQLALLTKALEILRRSPISDATRDQVLTLSMGIGQLHAQKVLSRALDELDAVPPTRVDTDPISVHHGVVVLFRVAAQEGTEGVDRSEFKVLIDRFLKRHRGIEISASDRPFGTGDAFSITGTKAAREKFLADPRWEKLQEALTDIYMAEYLPGYPSERPQRQILDTTKHVFGR